MNQRARPAPSASSRFDSRTLTTAQARDLQRQWADRVILDDDFGPVRYVAGTDVGFEQNNRIARGAVCVLRFPELKRIDYALARGPTPFPYIPGLLSFRELPVLLEAFSLLHQMPDLVLCDGQGLAHPRRFGIACHLGVLTGLPTIGVAKSRLIGRHEEPGTERGSWTELVDKKEVIGAVLRTRSGVNPVYVSSGHRVSLASAVEWVLAVSPRFRLPETTRQAHKLASGTDADSP